MSASRPSGGDWLVLQELLERGDPDLVDRIRAVGDAQALGSFAERWYANPSPNARRLLLAYLERPLNAYRHEAMVKRIFKRAEAAGDDAVMARFLVAFDRSIRRVQGQKTHGERQVLESRAKAQALVALWLAQGYHTATFWEQPNQGFHVWGQWCEPSITSRGGTTMPRGKPVAYVTGSDPRTFEVQTIQAPDWIGKLKLDLGRYRDVDTPPESARPQLERLHLFSVPTRQYLRRRAWRYFRRLGRVDPERYLAAITEALVLYEDADVADGLALIDNWSLVHALFHHSPVLEARRRGWLPVEGRSLSELEPAPIYDELWRSAPRAVFDLMVQARCQPVRHWALRMVNRAPEAVRAVVGVEELVGLFTQDQPEIIELAAEWLRGTEGLSAVGSERWLAVAEAASPAALEVLAEIMARQIAPDRIALADAARLAAGRPLPMARLGLGWLQARRPATAEERRGLLALLEAQAEPLRPEILAWLRKELASAPELPADWMLEFLDCRHADARAQGINWFRAEPRAHQDVTLWQRMLESPHDDVQQALVVELDQRLRVARADGSLEPDLARALEPDRLRLLWAAVLLNVRRGNRVKPRVIEQVAIRLEHRPEEAEALLPLLGVALGSLRGPEHRAALAAVVRLVDHRPGDAPLVQATFPELQWA